MAMKIRDTNGGLIMSKLTAPQMRALRLLNNCDVYTPGDPDREAAISKPTAWALQTAGYATVERLGRMYGEWRVQITKAGEAKLDPPPLEPGMSLAMFLVSVRPDGYSTNTESGVQALTVLASCLSQGAQTARRARDRELAEALEKAAVKVLGKDPDHVRWPVRLRFCGAGYQFFDYIAERCRDREEG